VQVNHHKKARIDQSRAAYYTYWVSVRSTLVAPYVPEQTNMSRGTILPTSTPDDLSSGSSPYSLPGAVIAV
jgi:hypothetical protein